jgi:hypothetical protein
MKKVIAQILALGLFGLRAYLVLSAVMFILGMVIGAAYAIVG